MTDKIYVIAWRGRTGVTGYFTSQEELRTWIAEFECHWKGLSPDTSYWYDEEHGFLWRSLASAGGASIAAEVFCLDKLSPRPYGRCPDAYSMY